MTTTFRKFIILILYKVSYEVCHKWQFQGVSNTDLLNSYHLKYCFPKRQFTAHTIHLHSSHEVVAHKPTARKTFLIVYTCVILNNLIICYILT